MDVKLSELACADCGVSFFITAEHQTQLRKNKKTFYCPLGHGNVYGGKTEEQRLRDLLAEKTTKIYELEDKLKKCAEKPKKKTTKKK